MQLNTSYIIIYLCTGLPNNSARIAQPVLCRRARCRDNNNNRYYTIRKVRHPQSDGRKQGCAGGGASGNVRGSSFSSCLASPVIPPPVLPPHAAGLAVKTPQCPVQALQVDRYVTKRRARSTEAHSSAA